MVSWSFLTFVKVKCCMLVVCNHFLWFGIFLLLFSISDFFCIIVFLFNILFSNQLHIFANLDWVDSICFSHIHVSIWLHTSLHLLKAIFWPQVGLVSDYDLLALDSISGTIRIVNFDSLNLYALACYVNWFELFIHGYSLGVWCSLINGKLHSCDCKISFMLT